MSIAYNAQAIPSSPFELVITPGKTHPRNCLRLHCPDPTAPLPPATAGTKCTFRLLARDFFNNPRMVGGDELSAGLRSEHVPERVTCDVLDLGDGTYEVSYVANVAAEYHVAVVLRSEPVEGSPYALRVVPAPTHGPTCVATGFALNTAAVGTLESFMVEAKDHLGNSRGFGGDKVQCVIKGPGFGLHDHPEYAEYVANVRDCEDGWYEVSYAISVIGRYQLHIAATHAADHKPPLALGKSPFKLTVSGGKTCPPMCNRVGAKSALDKELPQGTAGAPLSFVIEARDDFGDRRRFGGDRFVVTSTPTMGDSPECISIVDRSDGTYEITLLPTAAGAYLVGVTLDVGQGAQHIAGSRFVLNVIASSASADNCVASGSGLKGFEAGMTSAFAVQTWDSHGNRCEPPLSAFDVKVVGISSNITLRPKASMSKTKPGRYTFTYSTELAGTYEAHIAVATQVTTQTTSALGGVRTKTRVQMRPIPGSPFKVTVHPGCMHPPACAVQWETEASQVVGHEVRLLVRSRDRYYNDIPNGGDKVALELQSKGPAPNAIPPRKGLEALPLRFPGSVVDNKDGTYTCSAVTTVAGDFDLILDAARSPEAQAAFEAAEAEANEAEAAGAERVDTANSMARDAAMAAREEAEAKANAPKRKMSFAAAARLMHKVAMARKRNSGVRKGGTRIFLDVKYTPDVTSPHTTLVTGAALWQMRLMERGTWTIQPRDQYRNITAEEQGPQGPFKVLVTRRGAHDEEGLGEGLPSSADSPPPSRPASVYADEVRDVSLTCSPAAGDCLVSWLFRRSGTYLVHVSLHGVPLSCSPLTCTVEPPMVVRPGVERTLNGAGERQAALMRQTAIDRKQSNGVPWREEHVGIWEAHLEDVTDHVRKCLSRPNADGPPAFGTDLARTWRLAREDAGARADPGQYEEAREAEEVGGIAGTRGRYNQRKRSAMLHSRLVSMAEDLSHGGVGAGSKPTPAALAYTARLKAEKAKEAEQRRAEKAEKAQEAAESWWKTEAKPGPSLFRRQPQPPPVFGGAYQGPPEKALQTHTEPLPADFADGLPRDTTPRHPPLPPSARGNRTQSPRSQYFLETPRGKMLGAVFDPQVTERTLFPGAANSALAPHAPEVDANNLADRYERMRARERTASREATAVSGARGGAEQADEVVSRGVAALFGVERAGSTPGGNERDTPKLFGRLKTARKMMRIAKPEAQKASWRMLGPSPALPPPPPPAALTPRAQALARMLDATSGSQ